MMRLTFARAFQLTLPLVLAACSASAVASRAVPLAGSASQYTAQNGPVNTERQTLFLPLRADPPGQISQLSLEGKLVRHIRGGVKYPTRLAADGAQTLYVLNYDYQPTVTEYTTETGALLRTVKRGVAPFPLGMDVARDGHLWVLDRDGPLVRYGIGKTIPQFATYKGLCAGGLNLGPSALTVDPFGTAYVGVTCGLSFSSTPEALVTEYDGSPEVARTIHIPGNEQPAVLSTDQDGTLYLEFYDSAKSGALGISEYRRGKTTPALTFHVTPAVQYTGAFMSFDSSDLYLSLGGCQASGKGVHCKSFITTYKRGSSTHVRTIAAPSKVLFGGTTVDAAGNIYVVTDPIKGNGSDEILVYAPDGNKPTVFHRGFKLGEPMVYPNAADR